MSWPYLPRLLNASVPRYTSYPTAAEFMPEVGPVQLADALGGIASDAAISLYVHIPFCRSICWYCGCNTSAANRSARLDPYIAALHSEIDRVADLLERRRSIRQLAFGGGSPNAIRAVDFLSIVEHLHDRFDLSGSDLSVELDPRSLSDSWFGALQAAGVRRASLGVQTFSPTIQAAIGREQSEALIEYGVTGLRGAGVRSLNFDLMYGLPGQTLADLEDSIDRSIAHGADRIALFGYAHLPAAIPRQRAIDDSLLPPPELRFRMAMFGHQLLTAAGYRAIGFDHFALPDDPLARAARGGTLNRNFQGFTDDPSDHLLGLGASAITSLPGLLAQNEKKTNDYQAVIASGRLATSRGIVRSAEDLHRARAITQFLCTGETHLDGLDPSCDLGLYEAHDLVSRQGDRLVLASHGLPYARMIASCLDSYRKPAEARFSNAI